MFDNLWLNFNSEFTAAFCGHAYLRTALFYQKRDTKTKKNVIVDIRLRPGPVLHHGESV